MIGAIFTEKIGNHEVDFKIGYFKTDYRCKYCNNIVVDRKSFELISCISEDEKIIKDIIE